MWYGYIELKIDKLLPMAAIPINRLLNLVGGLKIAGIYETYKLFSTRNNTLQLCNTVYIEYIDYAG
jgi:hypothetical protein